MSPFYDRKEEDRSLRWAIVVIVALGLLTGGWLVLSGPGEERLTGTHAFDQRGAVTLSHLPHADKERRTDTGLTMVSASFGEGQNPTPAQEAAASAPSQAAPANPYAAPDRADAPPAATDKELAAAGMPTDAKGLQKLGAQRYLLSAAVKKLMDHPRVLKAILDNKLVVNALMGRETSKRNCSDPGALKDILSNPKSAPVTNILPIVQQALSRPESAAAMIGSELGARIMECPSTKAMTSDPSMMMTVAMSNPAALQLVADPRVAQALTANPQATAMFSNVQSGLGGLGGSK